MAEDRDALRAGAAPDGPEPEHARPVALRMPQADGIAGDRAQRPVTYPERPHEPARREPRRGRGRSGSRLRTCGLLVVHRPSLASARGHPRVPMLAATGPGRPRRRSPGGSGRRSARGRHRATEGAADSTGRRQAPGSRPGPVVSLCGVRPTPEWDGPRSLRRPSGVRRDGGLGELLEVLEHLVALPVRGRLSGAARSRWPAAAGAPKCPARVLLRAPGLAVSGGGELPVPTRVR